MFIFFFQAEDGIRDATVTGVQTCALPISITSANRASGSGLTKVTAPPITTSGCVWRSEEGRVGKEGRSRWAPDHLKKKKTQPVHPSEPRRLLHHLLLSHTTHASR